LPPTTNFALSDFGEPLVRLALSDCMASRDFVLAKRNVVDLLCRLFTMPENPKDPTSPLNDDRMLRVICQAMGGEQQAQVMLPSVPRLIQNRPQARMFIPALIDLVREVLPTVYNIDMLHDESALRSCALEALSALTSFVGYYHQIGRSDLIAETKTTTVFDINERIMSSRNGVPPIYVRNAIRTIGEKIDKCPFKKSKQKDQIFTSYVRGIFQMLMCSVLTEKTVANLQYITNLLVTHLHQYARYNPGYLLAFIELYVEQFQKSRNERISAVYVNGLNQAATVTWQAALSKQHCQQILTLIVQALSSCDQDLRRYAYWNPYHQVFINSIRCLSSWTSVSVENSPLPPEHLAKLMALLVRCNKFLASAIVNTHNQIVPKWGRKIQLTTSADFEDTMFSPDKLAAVTEEFTSSALAASTDSKSGFITSYTTLGQFGSDAKLVSSPKKKEQSQKVRTLSESLYKALTTTIEVFSTIILRSMDSDQHFGSHTPSDILLARMSLYQNIVPENRILLKACKPEIIDMLKDYVPICVSFYSSFRRAIYSKITFKRNYGDHWSDSVCLMTGRYPSGSKQWVIFPSMPLPDDYAARAKKAKEKAPPPEDVSPPHWVRTNLDIQNCCASKFNYTMPEAREMISSTGPLVDEQSELAIENIISTSFGRLHGNRDDTEVQFVPTQPVGHTTRGNMFDRTYLTDQHAIDTSGFHVNESMLNDLDVLDSMDRPFSTQVGLIYMRSPDSLLTNRDVAKGPLRGVGPYFNQFLNQLSLSQVMPVERLKQHPDDPTLMRYSFCINNFQVCYSLAPNVSSLISGSKMGPKDNQGFYNLLRKRGIAIMWIDNHPGHLNEELAWKFLSNFEDDPCCTVPDKSVGADTPNSGSVYTTSSSTGSAVKPRNESGEFSTLPSLSLRSTVVSAPFEKSSHSGQCRVFGCKNEAKRTQSSHGLPHRSKAREFLQKAIHITRRHAADHSDSTLSQYSSAESSIVDTVGDAADDMDIPKRCRAHSPESSSSSESPVPLLEALEAYVPSERSKKKWTESMTVPPTPNVTPASTLTRLPLSLDFSALPAGSASRAANNGGQSDGGASTGGDQPKEDAAKPTVRVLIALAPLPSTGGRLVKVSLTATGGTKEMNADFMQTTGPLMTNMVIESKNLAYLLSATVLDASANIASLNGDDFSVVYKRISMIKQVVETYCRKHETVDDVHKCVFPVGQHGLQNSLFIQHPDLTKQ
ncbi:hypothetical protein GGI06_001217, partial [Coemansia sp. S85]